MIITGSTGMAWKGVLPQCLDRLSAAAVLLINRQLAAAIGQTRQHILSPEEINDLTVK